MARLFLRTVPSPVIYSLIYTKQLHVYEVCPCPLQQGDGGWGRAHTWDQVLVYHAYTRSPVTGWTTVVSMQEASINGPIRHSLYLWAGGAILFLSLGVGLALLMARQITIPITALVQSLDLVRRGQRFVMPQATVQ